MELDAVQLRNDMINKRCVELGLAVRECAEYIGISPATLSRVENKKMPELITYCLICKWLEKPFETYIKH